MKLRRLARSCAANFAHAPGAVRRCSCSSCLGASLDFGSNPGYVHLHSGRPFTETFNLLTENLTFFHSLCEKISASANLVLWYLFLVTLGIS
ncbi:unnamed protein product [Acanthoscelides obtectus]|uniref:Uncharacterized protein n=1 Tax=Acanthoscelides obtectus TaxID=200917 RepID=A0A9P0KRH0_ACAOB|nr:unnamed protein product [Acanthoscelides obtectus]CAK1667645.1 hypothetical protein AOBTE_LOCUS25965 [Acanthoscelides obtectus]